MKNKIRLGVTAFTSKIYAGRAKPLNDKGLFEFTGETHDVTDDAINTVAEYMLRKCDNEGVCEFYFKGYGKLRFTKEEV